MFLLHTKETLVEDSIMVEFDYLLKICLFGDKDVGKKTLAFSDYVKNIFKEDYYAMETRGVELTTKEVNFYGKITRLQFWIISDDRERFQSIWEQYIKGSLGIIFMYDITNEKSLTRVSEWYQLVQNYKVKIPILLVGNKLDLEEQREISKSQVERYKEKYNISFSMEISVKTGENVEEMITKIINMTLNFNSQELKSKV